MLYSVHFANYFSNMLHIIIKTCNYVENMHQKTQYMAHIKSSFSFTKFSNSKLIGLLCPVYQSKNWTLSINDIELYIKKRLF